jgi:hypothetical protein
MTNQCVTPASGQRFLIAKLADMIAFIVHTQDGDSLLPTTHNLKIPLLYTQNRVIIDSSTDKQWILARRTDGPSTAYALVTATEEDRTHSKAR